MHELQVTESILSAVLQSARDHDVTKILRIHLEIGELNGMKDQWIQHYFDYLAKDTVAEGAEIKIKRTPVEFQCHDCNSSFSIDLARADSVTCPQCEGKNCSLSGGSDFSIIDMEAL